MSASPRKTTIILINLVIGASHLITGENYSGPYPLFVNGYMIDILLPLGFYLLLTLFEFAPLQNWMLRFALVFGLASVAEIAQGFGITIFGSTFDPFDFLMYALGALLAALLDKVLFTKLFEEK